MEEKKVTGYKFGYYRLLPNERLLLRSNKPVPLSPKVFDTLLVFVQNSGRLLSKDELLKLIWGESIVEEGNLTQYIFVIRKVLGETPLDHQYLVTIPLQGYRFVAKVTKEYDEPAEVQSPGAVNVGITSIAVLPFTILNSSSGDGLEGIGIADTLITKLSTLKRLVIRPTTAVLKYDGVRQDPLAVGEELQVDAVLIGSLQRVEERMRVNVRLVHVINGTTLWASNFDDRVTDVFAVQDSIAMHVAQVLELELSGEERRHLAQSYTNSIKIHQLYIKGRYFGDWTEQGLLKSIDYFRQVTELAPDSALGHVGLADSYTLLGGFLYRHPQDAFPAAKVAAEKALQLGEMKGEAYAALAQVAFFYEWDWAKAARCHELSTQLNADYTSGRPFYAWLLMSMGRFDEATESIRQAQKQAPVSLMLNTILGLPFYYGRKYEQAVEQYRETLDMDPHFNPASYYLALVLTHLGRYEEAIAAYKKVLSTIHTQQAVAFLGYTYAVAGEKDRALKILKELRQMATRKYVSPYLEAIIHTGLGEVDKALLKLEQASQERASWMVFLNIDPFLDRLRANPRFEHLLKGMGFPLTLGKWDRHTAPE